MPQRRSRNREPSFYYWFSKISEEDWSTKVHLCLVVITAGVLGYALLTVVASYH